MHFLMKSLIELMAATVENHAYYLHEDNRIEKHSRIVVQPNKKNSCVTRGSRYTN